MYREELEAYVPRNRQEAGDKEMMLEYLRLFPHNILTRENQIAHFTASGVGGHADGEADLLSVALREAREETGVVHIRPLSAAMASLEILPVWGHVKRGQWVPAHQHLNVTYLLTADESDPLQYREGENTGVAWLPADRLLALTNEWQMDEVYTKLLERARALTAGCALP